jgi:hypothetical protein
MGYTYLNLSRAENRPQKVLIYPLINDQNFTGLADRYFFTMRAILNMIA